ncbi:hypothetical protein ACFFX0_31085 [Citricoccus parietis]|uniref:Uncharacterized protein n=1 Tax=Citricoccus parietis TaxID=592307 RepID=A0ABV5G8U8_9MICC
MTISSIKPRTRCGSCGLVTPGHMNGTGSSSTTTPATSPSLPAVASTPI